MNNQIKLANFTHVMNDNMIGTTFIYFSQGTVQDLDKGTEHEYGEFCIWLDEQQHRQLEAALRNEPYTCTVFNEKEMKVLKQLLQEHDNYEDRLVIPASPTITKKPSSMTDHEWNSFLAKLS